MNDPRLFVLGPNAETATAWAKAERIRRFAPVDPTAVVFRERSGPTVVELPGWRDYRTTDQCRQVSAALRRLVATVIRHDDDEALAPWRRGTRSR